MRRPGSAGDRWLVALLRLVAVAALIWVIGARVLGPCDLWDNSQPRTVSYTTDIIRGGGSSWLLPVEAGRYPATKPPLYNWLAVVPVRVMGFDSVVAHKLPSLAALCGCWGLLLVAGRLVSCEQGDVIGAVAATMFVSCYCIFKTGYLARPDMVLTLWLLIAWLASAALLIGDGAGGPTSSRRAGMLTAVFWSAVVLAGLTKGTPALVALAFPLVAARPLAGRFAAIARLRWGWGAAATGVVVGGWLLSVSLIDGAHLVEVLWRREVYDRAVGGGDGGAVIDWLVSLPDMSFYYLLRFAPWSIASAAAIVTLMRHHRVAGPWLVAATLMVVVVIGIYSLSVGKRSIYIAAAIGPGALLAAWWLCRSGVTRPARLAMFVPIVAIVLTTLAGITWRQSAAPTAGFSRAVSDFVATSVAAVESRPAEVACFETGGTHVQAMMGSTGAPTREALRPLIERGRPFWVVAGRNIRPPREFDGWVARHHPDVQATPVVRSAWLTRSRRWPERLTLYWVRPKLEDRASAGLGADAATTSSDV